MKSFKILPTRNTCMKFISRNRSSETSKYVANNVRSLGSTVDAKEVEFHGKLNTTWWDTNGQLRALHSMNPLRVQFVRDGLANTGIIKTNRSLPLQGTKILDIGCGGGILSEPLARIGAEVIGIDSSKELIDLAKEHASLDPSLSGRVNYIHTTIEEFEPENAQKFDAVVASEVLEHVADQKLFLKCCSDTLKFGGSLFVTTLNKTVPSWLGAIVAAEHVLKLVPTGTHNWNKFISPEEVQRLVETCGLKTKLIHGMLYNPLKNEWSWSSCAVINYALHAIKHPDQ
ncbi:hypothetical protein KPH14_009048 [Odynerus spinipes]|uniref:Ubiquinone biosynthesis O-methyltransferase, mitochondrial n=1 Tax=Odynerus spinipes TaxID=1348599 RepID=A0AAD9RNU7_9HYME|nr:hypothetical protein KPH14_009048 [Odynerus spinipes]